MPPAPDATCCAIECWFGPKAFKRYFNIVDPAVIQQCAAAEIPLENVLESSAIGADRSVHVAKLTELFDSGATIVNVQCAQPDENAVLEFYGSHVLPAFRGRG